MSMTSYRMNGGPDGAIPRAPSHPRISGNPASAACGNVAIVTVNGTDTYGCGARRVTCGCSGTGGTSLR